MRSLQEQAVSPTGAPSACFAFDDRTTVFPLETAYCVHIPEPVFIEVYITVFIEVYITVFIEPADRQDD